MTDSGGGSAPGAEAILATTYRQVIAFIHDRAGRGDLAANRLSLGLRSPSASAPSRIMVRGWLANVASEARVHVDPEIAAQLIAALTARERLAPAAAERIWREVASDGR